ncbi:putative transcription factor sol4 [Fusarium oxysporum f. sp. albedinis]|nr:putative transcription factor sol4 [Fusarium oxysporum f. sp. albedinis]
MGCCYDWPFDKHPCERLNDTANITQPCGPVSARLSRSFRYLGAIISPKLQCPDNPCADDSFCWLFLGGKALNEKQCCLLAIASMR